MLLNQFQIFLLWLFVHFILWKILRQVNMQHLFSINLINWIKSCIKGKGVNLPKEAKDLYSENYKITDEKHKRWHK